MRSTRDRFLLKVMASTEGATPGVGTTSPPLIFSPTTMGAFEVGVAASIVALAVTASAAGAEVAAAVTVTVLIPYTKKLA